MRGEDFFEIGTVISTGAGSAQIRIRTSDGCEECTAKLFCSPGSEDDHTVVASDPVGVHPGDSVRIIIRGETMFKAAAILYGIPLLLLLAGLLLGMLVVTPFFLPRELFAVTLALVPTGAWYLFLLVSGKEVSRSMMPEIVAVNGHSS